MARVVGNETTASTRFRLLAHIEALRSAGFEVQIRASIRHPWRFIRVPLRIAELVHDTSVPLPADLMLIQKRTYPPPFAGSLKRKKIPVVFDVDDAIYLPPPSGSRDYRTLARYRRNFESTAAAANLVICGNREIASKVPHDRVATVPTALDCQRFCPSRLPESTEPVVGWVGHSDNLSDLQMLAEPLRYLARRHRGFRLVLVADRELKIDGVPIEYRRWSLESEISCFEDIVVGVMPLEDNAWTRAKCAFKLLQYMALGISAVASPVGMNAEVIEHGVNGLLADSPQDWVKAMDYLLANPGFRAGLVNRGRETVVNQYSLEVISPRLVELLQNVQAGPA